MSTPPRDAAGATVALLGAGYAGKRRALERIAAFGVHLVVIDEPGHWSESLVDERVARRWLAADVTGDPDADAAAVLAALRASGVHPDGVLTFWEDAVPTTARVATMSACTSSSAAG